ncbi:MAG: phosphoserine transaminase [Alphaproteobacteria bacterium]
MSPFAKPATKPVSTLFSTGPTRKRPGWSPELLGNAAVGRSHRGPGPKSKIKEVIDLIHKVLDLPDGYRVGIVPGSDTGAVEMAMWSLLGARGLDVLGWEAFGRMWMTDAVDQLRLDNVTTHLAEYGALPDLSAVNFDNDVIFPWNGTSSGVRVPNGDWIPDDRTGLTIADSTSACFAMPMPWEKLDVVTFSFQKALGGEGAHGVIILSPRAVERVNSYTPPWPMPKVLSLAQKGKLDEALFDGATINTPSLLVIEDALDALNWAESIGGGKALIARVDASFAAMNRWIAETPYFAYLAEDPATASSTSVCLRIVDDWFQAQTPETQKKMVKDVEALLAAENVAEDISCYRDAPLGLRIWCGPTVDTADVEALLPWLDWAYAHTRSAYQDKAA